MFETQIYHLKDSSFKKKNSAKYVCYGIWKYFLLRLEVEEVKRKDGEGKIAYIVKKAS